MEGDFSDIKSREEKKGGRDRQKSSFQFFKNFIAEIEIGDIKYR